MVGGWPKGCGRRIKAGSGFGYWQKEIEEFEFYPNGPRPGKGYSLYCNKRGWDDVQRLCRGCCIKNGFTW